MEKIQLAARQKRLEQHIAESKVLMAKLSAARTKEEKEGIMSILRERTRVMDEDMKAHSNAQGRRARWPETAQGSSVLIISDDEDDEDDET